MGLIQPPPKPVGIFPLTLLGFASLPVCVNEFTVHIGFPIDPMVVLQMFSQQP